MHLRSIAHSLIAVVLSALPALAQSYPPSSGYPQPAGGNVQPNQPVEPQSPTLVPRGAQNNPACSSRSRPGRRLR